VSEVKTHSIATVCT